MSKVKPKILFLGAATFQLPPIYYAKQQGYEILTLDNRPNNPGHQLADRCFNISTLDLEQVLAVARQENIDGVLAYASDVSARSAAYVVEQLGLPGAGYDSILNLTDKARFRAIQFKNRFLKIDYAVFQLPKDQMKLQEYTLACRLPCVVKPVDASGGRGIYIVHERDKLIKAAKKALAESSMHQIIIEDYHERFNHQLCGDGYIENGKILFLHFGDGLFKNTDSVAPYGEMFPSDHHPYTLCRIKARAEEILQRCGYHTGVFNLDAFISKDNIPFIIEIGPRNGGNYISSAVSYATGVDLTQIAVEACYQHDYQADIPATTTNYPVACYSIHSESPGYFSKLNISDELRKFIINESMLVAPGCFVNPYRVGRDCIGHLVLGFKDIAEMQAFMPEITKHCQLQLLNSPLSENQQAANASFYSKIQMSEISYFVEDKDK